MEVKLCRSPILPFASQRFCLEPWVSKKKSFKKNFRMLTEKWRFQILQISKGQDYTGHYSLHMVKEGETLSSISKQYGVSVYSIAAANKNIVDIDLVFCGQHLNIPSSAPGKTLKFQMKNSKLLSFDTLKRHQHTLEAFGVQLNQHLCTVALAFHNLSHAKRTGYFLVLVPLIAFCIRCIIGAFQNRVVGDLRHKDINGQEADYQGFRSVRWKSALDDIRDPDTLHTGQPPDSINSPEGETQVSAEEVSHAYTKLEHDYQQFLSECGISKWGYWRGGSHEIISKAPAPAPTKDEESSLLQNPSEEVLPFAVSRRI